MRFTTGVERATTAHASVHPTMSDLHWAAGFLEGEGHFAHNGNSERAAATQVQREPLERLLAVFGGRIGEYAPNGNVCRQWYVTGSRARGVMLTLMPLMSTRRREQIYRTLKSKRRIPKARMHHPGEK